MTIRRKVTSWSAHLATFIGFILVIGFFLLAGYLVLSGQGTFIEVIEIIGPLVLSGILVLMYGRMADIQLRQAELERLAREPVIEVPNFEINGDTITVYLSNTGPGIAKNIRIETVVDILDSDSEPIRIEKGLFRTNSEGKRMMQQSLGPQRQQVPFQSTPGFGYDQESRFGDFSTGIADAVREGHSEFEFWLYIRYSDPMRVDQSVPVFHGGRWIDLGCEQAELIKSIQESMDLERAFSEGGFARRN